MTIKCYTVPELFLKYMAHVRCILFFSFWDIFYSFTPLIAPKSKLKENEKISFFKDIVNLQMCTKNYDYMMYSS